MTGSRDKDHQPEAMNGPSMCIRATAVVGFLFGSKKLEASVTHLGVYTSAISSDERP